MPERLKAREKERRVESGSGALFLGERGPMLQERIVTYPGLVFMALHIPSTHSLLHEK